MDYFDYNKYSHETYCGVYDRLNTSVMIKDMIKSLTYSI
jgi:hypothetical protein